MNNNYVLAANWWSNKIQESFPEKTIPELCVFNDLLKKKIHSLASLKGSISISTYPYSSKILDDVAFAAMLPVSIPSGYEMKILLGSVMVYDSRGSLVANFWILGAFAPFLLWNLSFEIFWEYIHQ